MLTLSTLIGPFHGRSDFKPHKFYVEMSTVVFSTKLLIVCHSFLPLNVQNMAKFACKKYFAQNWPEVTFSSQNGNVHPHKSLGDHGCLSSISGKGHFSTGLKSAKNIINKIYVQSFLQKSKKKQTAIFFKEEKHFLWH